MTGNPKSLTAKKLKEGRRKEPGTPPVVFETRHRVQFREIDPYGHMNMAYYLLYYSDHRFEGMRTFIGLDLKDIAALDIGFHIRTVTIEYLRPIVADQEFMIRSHIAELGHGQCEVDFAMIGTDTGTDAGNKTLSTARMRIGCINKSSGRPCAWPPGLMERFYT